MAKYDLASYAVWVGEGPNRHKELYTPEDTIEMVVRKNHRYGRAVAGDTVIVEKSELSQRGAREALLTLEEHETLKRQEEIKASQPLPSKVSAIVKSVQAAFDEAVRQRMIRKHGRQILRDPATIPSPIASDNATDDGPPRNDRLPDHFRKMDGR